MDISFVIPVYNAGEYLKDCIESVVKVLDCDGISAELILVDDGSTDGSGEVCDKAASSNDKIRVIHGENSGNCVSRNRGIKEAKGYWICFLDHDDLLSPDAGDVLKKIGKKDCDIFYLGFENLYNNSGINRGDKSSFPANAGIKEFSHEEMDKLRNDCLCRYAGNKPLMDYTLLTTPWGKLYRREFLSDSSFYFAEGYKNLREEDVAFNLLCLSGTERAAYMSCDFYYHRVLTGSEGQGYKPDIMDNAADTLKVIGEIIKERYPDDDGMRELYDFRKAWELLYCVVLNPAHPKNPAPFSKRRKDFLYMVNESFLSGALTSDIVKKLEGAHRILGRLVKNKMFGAICLLNRIRYALGRVF